MRSRAFTVLMTAVVFVGVILAETPGVAAREIFPLANDRTSALTAFWIPILDMDADVDSDEPDGGVEFEADVDYGPGWGLRYDRYDSKGNMSLGLMYMGSTHTERITDRRVSVHAAYLTLSGYYEVVERLPLRVTLGGGGVVVDFSRGFDDTGGLAGLVSGGLGYEIVENLYVSADIGYFLWGYPGETIADGFFSMLGVGYRF